MQRVSLPFFDEIRSFADFCRAARSMPEWLEDLSYAKAIKNHLQRKIFLPAGDKGHVSSRLG